MIDRVLGKSKDYHYKGCTFRRTDVTTTVHVKPENDPFYHEELRNLYEIDDIKECGKRPFLTTIDEVKEYLDHAENSYK